MSFDPNDFTVLTPSTVSKVRNDTSYPQAIIRSLAHKPKWALPTAEVELTQVKVSTAVKNSSGYLPLLSLT
ncbi:hypothetical protein TNCV_2127191 [Trichonephila clavipes]|nr:hypothetical protein TNCV_2127191 [Trichonephila clavipes]